MNINDIDLKTLRKPVKSALSAYETKIGVQFQDFPDFTLTPDKPNSARAIIPVNYENKSVGDFYAIVFAKGDGTGDSKTYRLDDLIVPPQYQHITKPERVVPRAKTGIICEGFFPLFSITPKGHIAMYSASLNELSVADKKISLLWKIGQTDWDYYRTLNNNGHSKPKIYLTVGNSSNGERVGDPHSIYYGRNTADALQVVGFLGINDSNNTLLKSSKNWILPSKKN